MDRFKAVKEQNRDAGGRLDNVAQGLRGKDVDVSNAVNNFLSELKKLDIETEVVNGKVKPVFKDSMIEGLAGPEAAIKRIFNRMNKSRIDAYDVHKMKRFIDEQVSYGKSSADGLTGQTENLLKGLRTGLDDALDSKFPEYNAVNTQYADTRGPDAFSDIAGSKFNPFGDNAEKQVALSRLMSNAQSRIPLTDAIKAMEDVAKKYGAQMKVI